jgi:hypothetical protein
MRTGATERFDRHKRMHSGNFPLAAHVARMPPWLRSFESSSRGERSADLLRIIAAIGLLALLAWFDGGGAAAPGTSAAIASVPSP